MKVIGVAGNGHGAGKTYIATEIVKQIGDGGGASAVVAFADPMKRMMAALLDIPVWDLYRLFPKEDPIPELGGNSIRHAMQTLGTEWGRTCMGYDFWVEVMNSTLKEYEKSGYELIAIDDVRFPNEFNMLRENWNATMVYVDSDWVEPDAHPSEGQLSPDDFDEYFDYSETKEDFVSDILMRM